MSSDEAQDTVPPPLDQVSDGREQTFDPPISSRHSDRRPVGRPYRSQPVLPRDTEAKEIVMTSNEPKLQQSHPRPASAKSPLKPNPEVVEELPTLDCEADLRTFRVFTWLCAAPGNQSSHEHAKTASSSSPPAPPQMAHNRARGVDRIDKDAMADKLAKVHDFLWSNRRAHERHAYKRCRPKSYQAFKRDFASNMEMFRKQPRSEPASSRHRDSTRGGHSTSRRDLFNSKDARQKHAREFADAAETLFQFFLPLQEESIIAHKYWGGVNRITSVS